MKPSDIQGLLAGYIAAVPALAAFGAAIQFDPFQDETASKDAISARLLNKGVCIEIGYPDTSGFSLAGEATTFLTATCDVFVSEAPQVAHSPSKLALGEAVIGACAKRHGNANKPIACTDWATAISENGYVLQVLKFSVPVNIP